MRLTTATNSVPASLVVTVNPTPDPTDVGAIPFSTVASSLNYTAVNGKLGATLPIYFTGNDQGDVTVNWDFPGAGAAAAPVVTAPGKEVDFVSRFFAPRLGIDEDPVTGSSHCTLIRYWAKRLGKKRLRALQLSERGGELFCDLRGERVQIAGRTVLYLEGTIEV